MARRSATVRTIYAAMAGNGRVDQFVDRLDIRDIAFNELSLTRSIRV